MFALFFVLMSGCAHKPSPPALRGLTFYTVVKPGAEVQRALPMATKVISNKMFAAGATTAASPQKANFLYEISRPVGKNYLPQYIGVTVTLKDNNGALLLQGDYASAVSLREDLYEVIEAESEVQRNLNPT